MNFNEQLREVLRSTLGDRSFFDPAKYHNGWNVSFLDGSLLMFAPELLVSAVIVLLLLSRLFGWEKRVPAQTLALWGACAALLVSLLQFLEFKASEEAISVPIFSGLLLYDRFGVFFKVFLLFFLMLVVYFTRLSGIPDEDDGPDFYALLFGATLGMLLMSAANHLLIVFLAIEMASVPSYVLVGFQKGRKLSSEAALKYVVYGGGAAGVMLYGLSLVAGLLGTAELPLMADRVTRLLSQDASLANPTIRTLLIGLLLVFAGVAFKLSVFPFHFWCPDAFEGASAEVAGFLSVASKGAAFALTVRLALALVGSAPPVGVQPIFAYLGLAVSAIAVATTTFGNLAAYSQDNLKRLLAYSTIAHAGFMLMAIGAMLVVLSGPPPGSAISNEASLATAVRCVEGLLFYLWVYLFTNLGAFAIVALIRNEIFSEDLKDYAGLGAQIPGLGVCLGVCLFSLVGLPPLGGFWGKFVIAYAVFEAGAYHWVMYAVLVLAVANTVFSLFYYVRVLKRMFLDKAESAPRTVRVPLLSVTGTFCAGLAALVFLTGTFLVEPLTRTAREVAEILFM